MKRIAFVLSLLAVIAEVSACGGNPSHQQTVTESSAYRYGQIIGQVAYLDAMAKSDKLMAAAFCQEYTEEITSSFVPDATMIEFPEWKNSDAKAHPGWFFLGLKAGCK